MNSEEFGKTYLQHEQDIKNVLLGLKIYDEDLMHDTYLALHEHSQEAEIGNFVDAFVAFYKNLRKRQKKEAENFEVCDYMTMVEKYDRIDEDDWRRRERIMQSIDDMIEEFYKNPHPNERNHERACDVLELYRNGLTFREIARELGIKCSTVHEYYRRATKRLKANKN